jgi:hypothetical protein
LPARLDLASKLRALIAAEVEAALAPYRDLLAQARGAKPKRKPAAAPIAFKLGQRVLYRQGRGQFAAKVTRVDQERGLVEVERESDGKRVLRPAKKLQAAAAPARAPRGTVRVRRIENGRFIERELLPAHAQGLSGGAKKRAGR